MTALALLLYGAPLALWVAWRAQRSAPTTWAFALATGFSFDLVLVLLLGRVLPLEGAVWLSRLLETGALLALLGRERRRQSPRPSEGPGWSSAPLRGRVAGVVAAGLVALGLSLALSVSCALWDRSWHVPLVGSLRAERTPFLSVFDGGLPLYYHYAGNVHAAMLQILSFDRLHAATALARSHDVVFALFGMMVGGLVVGRCHWLAAPALTAATLLAGPSWVGPLPPETSGLLEALTNVLSYSFRPSAPLGLIFGLIFFASLLEGAKPRALEAIAAATALLTLSDEVALVSLGLVGGLLTLVLPAPFGSPRKELLARLGVAAVLLILCPLVLGGALSWAAEREPLALARGNAPGFYDRVLPLASSAGARRVLSLFLAPVLASVLGLLGFSTLRERVERHAILLFVGLSTLGALVVLSLHLGPDGAETVRFATLPQVLTPFVVLASLRDVRAAPPGGPRARAVFSLLLGVLALLLPLVSTGRWLVDDLPQECSHNTPATAPSLYQLDCRRSAAARAFEPAPARTIAGLEDFFAYAGCRPSLGVGRGGVRQHQITTVGPETGREALLQLATRPSTEEVRLVCREKPATSLSRFCKAVQEAGLPCVVEGDWKICEATVGARESLARKLVVGRPMPRGHLPAAADGGRSVGATKAAGTSPP